MLREEFKLGASSQPLPPPTLGEDRAHGDNSLRFTALSSFFVDIYLVYYGRCLKRPFTRTLMYGGKDYILERICLAGRCA